MTVRFGGRTLGWGFVLATGLAGASPAHGALPVILPRPGQIGFALQGQYGTLLKSGNLGTDFGSGGGLAVRMRYRMRYERAIGLSFEGQTLDARAPGDTAFARTGVSMLLTGADIYQMFNTEQKNQQYLSLGAGLAQIHYTLRDGETEYPSEGDGIYVGVGAGAERFFYRSLAADLSARYTAVFLGGEVNHGFQAAAGVIFYASY